MSDTAKKPAPKLPTTETPGATFPGNRQSLVLPDPGAKTPRERVTEAVRGKYASSLVEVRAADVVALAALVPDAAHTPVTAALRDGAAKEHRNSLTPDTQTVYQVAAQLAHLLETAREPAEQGA